MICNTPFLLRVLILEPLHFPLKVMDLKVTVRYEIPIKSNAFKVIVTFKALQVITLYFLPPMDTG